MRFYVCSRISENWSGIKLIWNDKGEQEIVLLEGASVFALISGVKTLYAFALIPAEKEPPDFRRTEARWSWFS